METKGETLIELKKRDQQIPDEVMNNIVSKAIIKFSNFIYRFIIPTWLNTKKIKKEK